MNFTERYGWGIDYFRLSYIDYLIIGKNIISKVFTMFKKKVSEDKYQENKASFLSQDIFNMKGIVKLYWSMILDLEWFSSFFI